MVLFFLEKHLLWKHFHIQKKLEKMILLTLVQKSIYLIVNSIILMKECLLECFSIKINGLLQHIENLMLLKANGHQGFHLEKCLLIVLKKNIEQILNLLILLMKKHQEIVEFLIVLNLF
ncbi:MAG: hypothetical protein EBZ77_07475 [Chitinophagia bacterium]|nr:hypothetical protein [Chitinophagia bacterium]